MATLGIIDAPSVFARAYRSNRLQYTSSDFPVNAVYGFIRALIGLVTETEPQYLVAVAEDATSTESRLEQGVGPTDEAYLRQTPVIAKVLEAFSIPTIELPGHRSSDVVATVTRIAASERLQVHVIASGQDFYQLLDKGITVENPFTGKRTEHGDIIARFGIAPARIPEYLALVGEESGKPAGVSGIGPKMARLLLEKCGSMEGVLAHIDEIERPALRDRIRENADFIRISSRLATFDSTLPLSWSPRDFERTPPDWSQVIGLIQEFELSSLLDRIPNKEQSSQNRIIQDLSQLEEFVRSIKAPLCLRVHMEGGSRTRQKPAGLAMATSRENAVYLPFTDAGPEAAGIMECARAFLENPGIPKVGHNLIADTLALKTVGINLQGQSFDTLLADGFLAPKRSQRTLGRVALAHLPKSAIPYKDIDALPESEGQTTREWAAACLTEAVSIIADLAPAVDSAVRSENISSLYSDLDIPVIPLRADLQHTGIAVDGNALKCLLQQVEEELTRIRRRAAFLAGDDFEIASDREVREVLFKGLRLPPPRKAPQGYAVDDDVLEELSGEHDLAQEILDYRCLDRMRMWLARARHDAGGTGRLPLTSRDPAIPPDEFDPFMPLQVLTLDAWLPAARETFVPDPGHRLVCGHFVHPEIRLLAHMSREQGLIAGLRNLQDPYETVTDALFGPQADRPVQEFYRRARTVQNAVIRGVGPADLARYLGVLLSEGRGLIDLYLDRFSGVRAWIQETVERMRKSGWASTVFGRPVPMPGAGSAGWREWMVALPYRTSSLVLNATVADMVLIALYRLQIRLRERGLSSRVAGFVSSGDILVNASPEEVDDVRAMVQSEMEASIMLSVPVTAATGSGMSWAEARREAENTAAPTRS